MAREIDADELLAHTTWVRRLARGLVRDAAAADDVVQETWLAALKARRAADAPLRPWLARVAANFARDKTRGEANRASRERESARSGHAPSAADTAERLEAQRLLVEALESLAEPYRTTVTLRYLDGLSAARIARRQRIPAGTVRWRLKHGMDELRARLDARAAARAVHGEEGGEEGLRGAGLLLLLPLCRRPPLVETAAGIGSAAAQGVLAMHAMTKIGIAAAIVSIASVGVWVAVDEPEPAPDPALAAPAAPEGAVLSEAKAESPAVALAPQAGEVAREAVPLDAAAQPPSAPTSAPAKTRLEARFLDRSNRPIAGVVLALEKLPDLRSPVSAADGRLVLECDLDPDTRSTGYFATCAGFATLSGDVTLLRGSTVYLGDLTLDPGGTVAGRVRRPDGSSARKAELVVTGPEVDATTDEARVRGPARARGVPEATTSADGSFEIAGVRAGPARVWASDETSRWTYTEVLDVPAGGVRSGVEIRLSPLEAEDTIDGLVLSPEGDPVPEAVLRYFGTGRAGTWSGNFTAGKDGRFQHRLPVRGPHDFVASDPQHRWTDVAARAVAPGTRDLVLRFPPKRWLAVSVRDAASAPIAEYAARVLSADRSRVLVPGDVEAHPDGRARLTIPSEAFVVDIRARGHGSAELGPFEPADAPESASCTLERRAGVRGRVTAEGKPVAGARVLLHEVAAADLHIESNGFATRLHPEPDDKTTTDAEGYYELDPNRPVKGEGQRFFQSQSGARSTFAVLALAEGRALAESAPLDVDPAVGLDGVDLELTRGGAIEGRVRVAPGKDPAGTVVAADRCDGRPRTQRVGPDGQFRFDHLTPGRWNVARAEAELREGSSSTRWSSGNEKPASYPSNCTVSEGGTTRFDLDLVDDRPCVLAVRVLVGGAPAAGWSVVMDPREGSTAKTHPGGVLDSAGSLRLSIAEPGAVEVELSPPGEAGSTARFQLPHLNLARGDNPLALSFETGSVRGQVLAPAPDVSVMVQVDSTSAPRLVCYADARPDAQGRFEVPFVMAGRARVSRMKQLDEGGTFGPVGETMIDVPARGTVDVSVP